MIVEISSGSAGFKQYLEHGKKQGRELHRDQLDQRVTLAGDLDVFELATSTHGDAGYRYDHITLSFAESYVSDEMLQRAVDEFRTHALSAWPVADRHRIAFYAEAHRPRMQSYTDVESGENVARLTHIHIGMGKHDLLTGRSIEPLGYLGAQADNLKYLDAWQESFNSRYGFSSPKDNPKITPENAVDVLARYTGQKPVALETFNGRKAALELALQKEIIAQNITTWDGFGELLATHGKVSKMRAGMFDECYRVMPHGGTRAMRLQGVFFQKQFIERSTSEKLEIISAKATPAYREQMQSRKAPAYLDKTLAEWHGIKAREIRYLHTNSKFYQEVYKPADAVTRQLLLNQLERKHHGIQSPTATRHRKTAAVRNCLPNMRVRNLDGIQSRSQMLLPHHDGVDVRTGPGAGQLGVGLRPPVGSTGGGGGYRNNAITLADQQVHHANQAPLQGVQASSVLGRIQTEMRERYAKASDSERYSEIRKNIDCAQLLNAVSHSHGLNADLYRVATAQDGTPRIQCGSRALTPSDFLTKELGLAWRDAAPILRRTYDVQLGARSLSARKQGAPASLWKAFTTAHQLDEAAASARLRQFDVQTKVLRVSLLANLKGHQSNVLMGQTGVDRKACLSLEKWRAATVKAELTEERRALRKAMHLSREDAWHQFLRDQARRGSEEALAALRNLDAADRKPPDQSIGGTIYLCDDEDEKRLRRRARASAATMLRSLTHSVGSNGDVTYSKYGRAMLRDEGRHLAVLDIHSEAAIAAALWLGLEKFGPNLTLTGSDDFQRRVVLIVVLHGIPAKFVDSRLEDLRLQLEGEMSRKHHSDWRSKLRGSPPQRSQGISDVFPISDPIPPTAKNSEDAQLDVPAQSVHEIGRAHLVSSWQEQGFNVEPVIESRSTSGKVVQITLDGFMVQKVSRSSVVIHELAALDGAYVVGQLAEIKYVDSRGGDLLQVAASRNDLGQGSR